MDCRQSTRWSREAFTLVELLVVIAIIGILVALLLPAIQSAREAARRMTCTNHEKQLGIALHLYHDSHKVFPYGMGGTKSPWSWSAYVLPYVEEANAESLLDYTVGYNTAKNGPNIKNLFPFYQCPTADPNEVVTCCISIPGVQDAAETNYSATATHRRVNYAVDADGSGVMFDESRVSFKHITDGTANTLLVGEVYSDDLDVDLYRTAYPSYCPGGGCAVGKPWASENRVTTGYGINSGANFDLATVESMHVGGANMLFADGHVGFLKEEVDQLVLDAITTRAGGEVIDPSSL